MTATDSLHHEILVAAPPPEAFRVFTERTGDWWPGELSVLGEGAVEFTSDATVIERKGDAVAIWAEVTTLQSPERLVLSWHPGAGPDRATHVEIVFTAQDDQTLVVVEQSGLQGLDNAQATAAEYEQDWPSVLEAYAGAVGTTD